MASRRTFIETILKGSAGLGLFAGLSPFLDAKPTIKNSNLIKQNHHNSFDIPLTLGGVPLAGAWIDTPIEDAIATMEAAWNAGIRSFDTSPRYGIGTSERRMGAFLSTKKQEEYSLSTKVGRVLFSGNREDKGIWKCNLYNDFKHDYTANGARKSVEDSLLRMGLSKLDTVYIHDLSPDNGELKGSFEYFFQQAAKGAIPELQKMKEEGIIKAWGFGINRPDAAIRSLEIIPPDICLLATQFSLLDHEEALNKTFPALQKQNTKVVVGSPLNCGFLAGNNRWNYSGKPAPSEIVKKYNAIKKIADREGVNLVQASLQFSKAHAIIHSIAIGARNPKQITEDIQAFNPENKVSPDFWKQLKNEKLIAENSPI